MEKHDRDFICFLYWFNAVLIAILAALFTAEAFNKVLNIYVEPVPVQAINGIFMASLGIYAILKRVYRWNTNGNNKRRGEFIAIGFLGYMAILLVFKTFLQQMVWPENIYWAVSEIVGLLIGNEAVKRVDIAKNQNGETKS